MTTALNITNFTAEERRNYIKESFLCITDCNMCGICSVFHGKDAEAAYEASIRGECSFETFSWITDKSLDIT